MNVSAPISINVDEELFVRSDARGLRNYALGGLAIFAIFAINTVDALQNDTALQVLPQLAIALGAAGLTLLFYKKWRTSVAEGVSLSPSGFTDWRVNDAPVLWRDVQDIEPYQVGFNIQGLQIKTGEAIASKHHHTKIAQALSSDRSSVFVDATLLDTDLEHLGQVFLAYWNHHAPQKG